MPIRVQSLSSNAYILHYCFTGDITATDLAQLGIDERTYYDKLSDDEVMSVVLDWSNLDTIPANLFPQLQNMRLVRDEQVYWIIVVGANPYLRALAISLGVITANRRFTFRSTYDEALVILGETPDEDVQPCRN